MMLTRASASQELTNAINVLISPDLTNQKVIHLRRNLFSVCLFFNKLKSNDNSVSFNKKILWSVILLCQEGVLIDFIYFVFPKNISNLSTMSESLNGYHRS